MPRNLYSVLGVDEAASTEEIRKSFLRCAFLDLRHSSVLGFARPRGWGYRGCATHWLLCITCPNAEYTALFTLHGLWFVLLLSVVALGLPLTHAPKDPLTTRLRPAPAPTTTRSPFPIPHTCVQWPKFTTPTLLVEPPVAAAVQPAPLTRMPGSWS